MSVKGLGTHWKGPLLASSNAGDGLFDDIPIGVVDRMRSPYACYYEDFSSASSITNWESAGWTETAVGTAASRSIAYSGQQRALIINADTVADEGTSSQYNSTSGGPRIHLLYGVTSTATLMDNQELIWATRISFLVGDGSTFDSKALLGWFVTDTALMTPSTGALAIASGGGIGFHISGDAGGTSTGSIDAVVQGTTSATSTATGVTVTDATTTFAGTGAVGWIDLGFRARWVDASAGTGTVDFYVNGVKRVSIDGATTALPMQSTQTYSNTIELINGPATADQVDMGVAYMFNAITRPALTYPYSSGINQ
jgi:hypothetical protein